MQHHEWLLLLLLHIVPDERCIVTHRCAVHPSTYCGCSTGSPLEPVRRCMVVVRSLIMEHGADDFVDSCVYDSDTDDSRLRIETLIFRLRVSSTRSGRQV